jgi:AcrR family transcriptional regulator
MAAERPGAGNPERSTALLWAPREPAGRARGRDGLNVGRIVRAAVEQADAEGLTALSMRRVAERLGFTTMSLYRHVPGKAELVDLMQEAVLGEIAPPGGRPDGGPDPDGGPGPGGGSNPGPGSDGGPEAGSAAGSGAWRPLLESWARMHWALHERHPWLAELGGSRHVPGPNAVADYEYALSVVSGTGLEPAEVVAVVGLVGGFVQAAARQEAERRRVEQRTGVTEEEWWGARGSLFDQLGSYPTLGRIWAAGGYDEPEDPFEFGLRRVLDGVEVLVRSRPLPAATAEPREGRVRDEMPDETRDERPTSPPGTCAVCGRLVDRSATGRRRAYCSRACQQRAYRERRAGSG